MLRICRSLFKDGFQPVLMGRSFPDSPPIMEEPFPTSRIRLMLQKGKAAYLELNLRFLQQAMNQEFEAICAVDLDTLPAAWFLSKIRKVPLIHDAHEYMEQVPEVFNRPLTRAMWYGIARTFLPSVNFAYTVSDSLAELMTKRYGIPFHCIPNIAAQPTPVPETELPPLPFGDQPYWVFLGAVNRGRGLEEFIPLLAESNKPLLVLGNGDVLEEVKELTARLGLQDKVFFAGKVRPEVAAAYLQKAWAGINLLRDEGLSYRFSLANKFFDYLHAGIPQICIRFPEYESRMKELACGCLCDLDPDSIRQAMQEISIPENQNLFRLNARKAANRWNWETTSERLLRHYRGLGL